MSIEPKFLTFDEMLQKRLFKIPDYQRAYSWTTRERNDLFKDILKLLEYNDGTDNYRNHFMATVVCCAKPKVIFETDEYEDFDIVDGQQRITTLIILLRSILKHMQLKNSVENKKTIRNIEELIVKDEDNKLILIQTNHESSIYLRDYLLTGTVPDSKKVKTHATKNLVKAFEECETFVSEWEMSKGTVLELLTIIKNRLNFILHVIEEEATVYTVFEVLNSRGLDVDWLDKCKSVLMGIAFEKLNKNNTNFNQTIEYLHAYWSQIYKEIGTYNISGSEIVRFTSTLYNPEPQSKIMKPEDSIEFFKAVCEVNPENTVEISKWLLDVTCELRNIEEDKRIQAVTNIIHTRLVYVAINLSEHFDKKEAEKLLDIWERTTFKIFGLSHKDSRTQVGAYTKLANKIMDIESKRNFIDKSYRVREIVEKFRALNDEFPINEAVKIMEEADCYNNWEKQLLYLYYKYERYLCEKSGYNLNDDVWNAIWNSPTNDSIEHIYPQAESDDWKGKVIKRKDFHLNRLGNLIILPIKMNKRAGNKGFGKKKDIYSESSLKSTKDILNYADWDYKQIENRTKELLEWIKEEWSIKF